MKTKVMYTAMVLSLNPFGNTLEWAALHTHLTKKGAQADIAQFIKRYPDTKDSRIDKKKIAVRLLTETQFSTDINEKNWHGRGVNVLTLKCADCGCPAKLLITEEDGQSWLYCGKCEIG